MKKPFKVNVKAIITFLIILAMPLAIVLTNIYSGNISFWYDNARDLIQATNNLTDPTLIGPPAGIPGVFYGPYWIWVLSLSLLISKDPRVVDFFVGVIPYFMIFPFILFKFSKLFSKSILYIVYLLFIFSLGIPYAVNMWNPHPAPLLTLILIYLLTFVDYIHIQKQDKVKIFFAGVVSGLIINFHIAFGIGLLLGSLLFFSIIILFQLYKDRTNKIRIFKISFMMALLFLFGILLTFTPFFIFEIRNGFLQTQTLANAVFKYGGVVEIEGLSKNLIIQIFFGRFGTLLGLSSLIGYFIGAFLILRFMILKKYNNAIENLHIRNLLFLLVTAIFGILFIYLTANNPVWDYHFIGVEIFFILLLAIHIDKNTFLKFTFVLLVIFVTIINLKNFNNLIISGLQIKNSLSEKRDVVRIIGEDGKKSDYVVFAYSSSIYTYEYSYLFKWIYNKDFSYDPGEIRDDAEIIYLIIPDIDEDLKVDFINYRGSKENFKTVKTWDVNDIMILKREKIN